MMRLGDAVHALSIAFKDYAPYPEDAATLLRDHFKLEGRVYFGGSWMTLDMFIYNLPRFKAVGDIRLTFFGGPPTKRRYRTGTLLDYVYDTCMYELSNGDPDRLVHDFIHRRLMEQHTMRGAI